MCIGMPRECGSIVLDQTKGIERAVAALDLHAIQFQGSDSLDNAGKVDGEHKAAGGSAPASPE